MQKQTTKKHSKVVSRAFISAVVILTYEIFVFLMKVFLSATGILHCDRQDFGACALQNLFVDLFGFVAALILGFVVPVCWLLANGILIVVGWKHQDGRRNLLVASLAINGLAAAILCLFWLVVLLF